MVLNRAYAFLAWYAHNGHSATQVLTGRVLAVHPAHRTVRIYVRHPSGWTPRYEVTTDGEGRFRLGAAEAGDPYFGTGERGVWMAWAEDVTTGTRSNMVFWKVTWWVVHLKQ